MRQPRFWPCHVSCRHRLGFSFKLITPPPPPQAMDAALRLPPLDTLDPVLLAAAGLAGRSASSCSPPFSTSCCGWRRPTPRRFAVEFRTFGDDLPRVAREFNALCRGQHPLFPGQRFGGGGGDGGGAGAIEHSLYLDGDAECFG